MGLLGDFAGPFLLASQIAAHTYRWLKPARIKPAVPDIGELA
jgi:hypothetical protein